MALARTAFWRRPFPRRPQSLVLEVGSVPAQASVLVVSIALVATHFPPCTVYPELPFVDTLIGTATNVGTVEVAAADSPVPGLSGARLHVQGGAIDTGGRLLGKASLTPGMEIRIGDLERR